MLFRSKPAEDEAFRAAAAQRGIRTFIHSPYLVNLGSPTAKTYENSVAVVAHNLRRAAEIGAEGVVVHTGSYVDTQADPEGAAQRHAAALTQVREGLLPILDALGEDGPWLLLEPTAGQGRSLCAGVEDLGDVGEAIGDGWGELMDTGEAIGDLGGDAVDAVGDGISDAWSSVFG